MVGDWHLELHEQAVFEALGKLGHDVLAFPWFQYFQPQVGRWSWFDSLFKRAQNKYLMGPLLPLKPKWLAFKANARGSQAHGANSVFMKTALHRARKQQL